MESHRKPQNSNWLNSKTKEYGHEEPHCWETFKSALLNI